MDSSTDDSSDSVDSAETADSADTEETDTPVFLEPEFFWVDLDYGAFASNLVDVWVDEKIVPPTLTVHLSEDDLPDAEHSLRRCRMEFLFTALPLSVDSDVLIWETRSLVATSSDCHLNPATWGETPTEMVASRVWGFSARSARVEALKASMSSMGHVPKWEIYALGSSLSMDSTSLSSLQVFWGWATEIEYEDGYYDLGTLLDSDSASSRSARAFFRFRGFRSFPVSMLLK